MISPPPTKTSWHFRASVNSSTVSCIQIWTWGWTKQLIWIWANVCICARIRYGRWATCEQIFKSGRDKINARGVFPSPRNRFKNINSRWGKCFSDYTRAPMVLQTHYSDFNLKLTRVTAMRRWSSRNGFSGGEWGKTILTSFGQKTEAWKYPKRTDTDRNLGFPATVFPSDVVMF